MGSPQVEDGYIRIARELHDALIRTYVPDGARRIFDMIIGKTYGWQKKEDRISLSQFVNATGMDRKKVCRSINWLEEANMITVTSGMNATRLSSLYRINKEYPTWKLVASVTLPKTSGMNNTRASVTSVPDLVSPVTHTKEDVTKETQTKENPVAPAPVSGKPDGDVANRLIDSFLLIVGRRFMGSGVRSKYAARLKKMAAEYGEEKMIGAWKAMANNPWLMGDNPGQVMYCQDPAYAFRVEKVEQYILIAEEQGFIKPPKQEQTAIPMQATQHYEETIIHADGSKTDRQVPLP